MKAERRHDLETNDLTKKIIQAPDFFKQYGGRILLGTVLVVAIAMLVNFRVRAKREDLAASLQGLSSGRDAVTRLLIMDTEGFGRPDDMVARQRQELISATQQALDTVVERSDDPKLLAQAAALRGDLYWAVANLAPLPGAATRPALAVQPAAADALNQAETAYTRVVDGYKDQLLPVVAARNGLAAIAENRGQWDEARRQYQALASDPNVPESFKAVAAERERRVAQLEKGVYLARPAAATQPVATTTAPTAATPTTEATATAPAAATQPAGR